MRIGLLSRSGPLLAYQARAVESLAAVPGVELRFVLHPIVENGALAPNLPRKSPLYEWWRRAFHFKPGHVPLEEKEPLTGLRLHPMPLDMRWVAPSSFELTRYSEDLLRALDFDVILNLTTLILRGSMLTIPRWGIWSFHHGDPANFRGGPPGFWEIYRGVPESGAVLFRLRERLDDGQVLRRARLSTIDCDYAAQRHQIFEVSIPWPAEVAADLLRDGALPCDGETSPSRAPITRWPDPIELAVFLLKLGRNKVRRWLTRTRTAKGDSGLSAGTQRPESQQSS